MPLDQNGLNARVIQCCKIHFCVIAHFVHQKIIIAGLNLTHVSYALKIEKKLDT